MDDHLARWFDEFRLARRSAKPSRHTERAWQADYTGICSELAHVAEVPAEALRLEHVTTRPLRHAFAHFADSHSAASIARAWSTWNQFFSFLVAEEVLAGNPMAAVAKPRVPRGGPKPLQGEDSVERLLGFLANGGRRARDPWPERDLAFIATDLLTGCRLDELLTLNLGSVDGRPGERRLKVVGKGNKERFLPIEEPLERIIDRYLESRRHRFPKERRSPTAPLFVDRHGNRLRPGGRSISSNSASGRPASGPRCRGGRSSTPCGTRSPPGSPKTAPPPRRADGRSGALGRNREQRIESGSNGSPACSPRRPPVTRPGNPAAAPGAASSTSPAAPSTT